MGADGGLELTNIYDQSEMHSIQLTIQESMRSRTYRGIDWDTLRSTPY